ncbi:MAG: pyrroline-5-carboxylate reductase [Sumerlaeia bacterium]
MATIPSERTLGFIGSGNMAEAIVRGLIAGKLVGPSRIVMADKRQDRVGELAETLRIVPASDNSDLLDRADIVVLAVKPQNLDGLIEDLGLGARPEHLFISILAGVRSETLEGALRHQGIAEPRVVRVMPNTPALYSEGAAGISAGRFARPEDVEVAQALFDAVGVTAVVSPSLMDAVTGLSGSGPAYVFRMIEALIDAGVAQGIDRAESARLVKQTVYGAALMAMKAEPEEGQEPGDEVVELRRRVTSPGGTTERGIATLDERGFAETIGACVDAARRRSVELGGFR